MSRALPIIKAIALSALLMAGASDACAQYVLGSPNSILNSDAWSLDSANMAEFRTAITTPANFGPGGVVSRPISIVDLTAVTPTTLSGLNGLMVPWWNNTQSTPYLADIKSAFLGGMDLWLLEDDSSHNAIGTFLGITSTTADGTPSSGTAPLFTGPFGTASNVLTFGNFDQFNAGNIASLGGTVIGRNTSNQVTVAYWNKGAFAPGAGRLIIFSDVDLISNWSQHPYTPTLNANGIFALNSTAAFIAVPEPMPLSLMALGLGVVFAIRRRRSGTGR